MMTQTSLHMTQVGVFEFAATHDKAPERSMKALLLAAEQ